MWGEDFFVTWGAVTSLDVKMLRAGDPLPSSGAPGILFFGTLRLARHRSGHDRLSLEITRS